MIRTTLHEILTLRHKIFKHNTLQQIEFTNKEKQLILEEMEDIEPLFAKNEIYDELILIREQTNNESAIEHPQPTLKYLTHHKDIVEIFFHLYEAHDVDHTLYSNVITTLLLFIATISNNNQDAESKLEKIVHTDVIKIYSVVDSMLCAQNFYALNSKVISGYIETINQALDQNIDKMIQTINQINAAIGLNLDHQNIISGQISLDQAIDDYQYPDILIQDQGTTPEGNQILLREEIKDKKVLNYILDTSKKFALSSLTLTKVLQQVPNFLPQKQKKLAEYFSDNLYVARHNGKKYTTTLLPNDDLNGLSIGKKTNSCMFIGGHSMEEIVLPSYTSPWSGYMVVYKGKNDIHAAAYMWMAQDEKTENPLGVVVNSYESIHLNQEIFIQWLTIFANHLNTKGLKLYFGYHAGQTPNFKIINSNTNEDHKFHNLAKTHYPKPMDDNLPIYPDVENVVEILIGDNFVYKQLTPEEEVINDDCNDVVILYHKAKELKQKYKCNISTDVYSLQDKMVKYFELIDNILKNNKEMLDLSDQDMEMWHLPNIDTCKALGVNWEDPSDESKMILLIKLSMIGFIEEGSIFTSPIYKYFTNYQKHVNTKDKSVSDILNDIYEYCTKNDIDIPDIKDTILYFMYFDKALQDKIIEAVTSYKLELNTASFIHHSFRLTKGYCTAINLIPYYLNKIELLNPSTKEIGVILQMITNQRGFELLDLSAKKFAFFVKNITDLNDDDAMTTLLNTYRDVDSEHCELVHQMSQDLKISVQKIQSQNITICDNNNQRNIYNIILDSSKIINLLQVNDDAESAITSIVKLSFAINYRFNHDLDSLRNLYHHIKNCSIEDIQLHSEQYNLEALVAPKWLEAVNNMCKQYNITLIELNNQLIIDNHFLKNLPDNMLLFEVTEPDADLIYALFHCMKHGYFDFITTYKQYNAQTLQDISSYLQQNPSQNDLLLTFINNLPDKDTNSTEIMGTGVADYSEVVESL